MIFFVGTQAIYYGMQFNGGNHPRNPTWHFVKGLHDFITYGTLLVLGGAFLVFIVMPLVIEIAASESTESKSIEVTPHEEVSLTNIAALSSEAKDKQLLEFEQLMLSACEQEKKKIEEQQNFEEQKKQEAIQRRRERSADAVAHDALNDFL